MYDNIIYIKIKLTREYLCVFNTIYGVSIKCSVFAIFNQKRNLVTCSLGKKSA